MDWLEKMRTLGSNNVYTVATNVLDDGPSYVVWLPKECDTIEEWLEIVANPDVWREWHAVSSRGVEKVYYGLSPPID